MRRILLPMLILPLLCTPRLHAQTDDAEFNRFIQQQIDYHKAHPDRPLTITRKHHEETGSGSGGEAAARGDGVKQVSELTVPPINLPGGGGGGLASSKSKQSATLGGFNWWYAIGAALVALGCWLFWFFPVKNPDGTVAKAPDGTPLKGNPHLARIAWTIGGVCLAIGYLGPIFWVIVIGGGVLAVVATLAGIPVPALAHRAASAFESARAMAESAANLPRQAFVSWQDGVRAASTRPTDAVIMDKIVRDDGLHELNAIAAARSTVSSP